MVYHPLGPVHVPDAVYEFLTSKVHSDLPALAGAAGTGADITGTLAGALRALTRASGGGGTDGGTKEPKSISEVYRETYGTLLLYCRVTESSAVAPVWTRLANCAKSERYTIVTQELQCVCMERKKLAPEVYVPVVTTALLQMIVGFQFAGFRSDDLGTGCQPFSVAYSGGANHVATLSAANLSSQQLTQGDQNANLADMRVIRESEKLNAPTDISQTCITMHRYAVLCQALFQGEGVPNEFVETQWKLANDLQNAAPFIADKFQQLYPVVPAAIYFPTIVHAVQVAGQEHLQLVATNPYDLARVGLPEYRTLVSDLRRGTFHNSTNWLPIPEGYLTPVPRISAAGTTESGRSVATTATTGASSGATTNTGVLSLTNNTQRPTIVARIKTPNNDPDFRSIVVRPGGYRPVLLTHPAPNNDANQEFCLAWWLRGSCFPNCGKRATHVPFASAAERTRLLLTFCRAHVAAPSPAGA